MDFKGQKSTPYIVDILHQHGVEHVVICPGSRNAPLTLAFTRHGKFNCLSIVDERSAGYFALGLAQTSGPVVLVCTSGTAPLNFAPAIAEAFHQHIPLIVLTADRPESWIHQQDGQAIEQKNIFANIIARSYHLRGELYCPDDLWHAEKVTNEAIHISMAQSRPVHINVSFAESLYNDSYEPVNARKIEYHDPRITHFTNWSASDWSTLLKGKKNILVVIGQYRGHEKIPRWTKELNQHPNVVIVAENLSNLPSDYYITNASEAICKNTEEMKPDAIIYLGGPIVSKQLKKHIRSLSVPIIRVQSNSEEVDTFQNNVAVVNISVIEALWSMVEYFDKNKVTSGFAAEWKSAAEKAKRSRDEYLKQVPFSDLKVFEWISKHLPSSSCIHLGNSTPVRYAQLFNDNYPNCYFLSNRGTSGIDGSVSTAVGFSYSSGATNVLIVGDLSFQYDSNAFFNKHTKGYLKVIIINNSGGNIFRVIDGPRGQKERSEFFETSVNHEFSNLAKHFNLNYFSAKDEKELNEVWDAFIKLENRPSVLEIFTDAEISANTFKEFYKNIQP